MGESEGTPKKSYKPQNPNIPRDLKIQTPKILKTRRPPIPNSQNLEHPEFNNPEIQ
jgi:hypothetical protein